MLKTIYNNMLSTKLKLLAAIASLCLASLSSLAAGPLKVFILCGQSNMQGHAHISTFEVMELDPKAKPLLEAMVDENGEPRVLEDVWISSLGSSEAEKIGQLTAGYGADKRGVRIGPEFTFGIYMHKALNEPILLIKTAWGGKSLHTDFRPPSAGPYTFNKKAIERLTSKGEDVEAAQAKRSEASGHYYRLMLEQVEKVLGDIKRVYPDYDASKGYELAGFVWFQGWNDMVDGGVYPDRYNPGGYDDYSKLLAQFIKDVRNDLSAPELPFVIGVMGAGGPTELYGPGKKRYKGVHQHFRDAMAAPAALPEFQGNVIAVQTENYWDMELDALRAREGEIKGQIKKLQLKVKQGKLNKEELKKTEAKLYDDAFSEREMTILKKGASNFEFHYLGSAKILGQIGKAFAEANAELLKK